MKNLIGKYRLSRLTPDELRESREKANAMTDDELSKSIFADWNDFEPESGQMNEDAENHIYSRIASNWLHRRKTVSVLWRWISIAAMIAVPVLLFTTIYFHGESNNNESGLTCVSTGYNEKASVLLPDGTEIAMNGNSHIEYDLATFSRECRNITFSGEGYFNVAKEKNRPFIIGVAGMEITVKGTVFDLHAYEDNDYVSLFLLDGAVVLRSEKTDEQVELRPNEKAVMNRTTGLISVSQIDRNDNPAGWKSSKLFFHKAELDSVISQIEEHFDCTIVIDDSVKKEYFSGLVPIDNISGALSVIEKAFDTRLAVVVRE